MKKKILIVVDVQNDFVDGALGTKEAQAMLPSLVEKIKGFDGEIIFTQDTHTPDYANTQEGKLLPVAHCIEGTDGWEVAKAVKDAAKGKTVRCYKKPIFGSIALLNDLMSEYEKGEIESIELVGICTDICVVSNALMLKSGLSEVPIYVDALCCAGVSPKKHKAALEVMKSCQIRVTGE